MMMPKLWLPPKVWFHGSQSTSTRGSSASTGMDWFICCRLAAHMPCVTITALGSLVEPEVNMNLAMLSAVMAPCAASTAGVAGVASRSLKGRVLRPAMLPVPSTTFTSAATVASMARANRVASLAKTRPGVSVSSTWRSLSKSWLMVEYAVDTVHCGTPATRQPSDSSAWSRSFSLRMATGRSALRFRSSSAWAMLRAACHAWL